jgi:hypothetical protein
MIGKNQHRKLKTPLSSVSIVRILDHWDITLSGGRYYDKLKSSRESIFIHAISGNKGSTVFVVEQNCRCK